jgi:hypothetical protein
MAEIPAVVVDFVHTMQTLARTKKEAATRTVTASAEAQPVQPLIELYSNQGATVKEA